MKKIAILAAAFATFALVSCSQSPKDLAKEGVQLMIEQFDLQESQASPEEMAKMEERLDEYQKKINALTTEEQAEYTTAMEEEVLSNKRLQEISSKLMNSFSMSDFNEDVFSSEAELNAFDFGDEASTVEETTDPMD